MCNKLIFIALFLFLSSQGLFSQVTIGSLIKPNEGSLLDLKQFENKSNNATSNLGLLLPRVALNTISSLYPCDEDSRQSMYIGLIVYNTTIGSPIPKSSCDPTPSWSSVVFEGINVWDGKQWIPLNKPDKYPKPSWFDNDVKFIKDQDGNVYPVKQFGSEGLWMLENMRAKTLPKNNTGYPISIGTSTPTRINSTGVHTNNFSESTVMNLNKNYYQYPSPPIEYKSYYGDEIYPPVSDDTFFKEYDNVGLRYNFYMSFNNDENDIITEDVPGIPNYIQPSKDSSGNYKSFVQGICPDGWHIPYQAEFISLFQTIVDFENSGNSESGVDTQFAIANSITDIRYPLTACLPSSPNDNTRGASKPALQGGFAGMWCGADSPYASNATNPSVADKNGPKEYGLLSTFAAVCDTKTKVKITEPTPDLLLIANYWYGNVWIRPDDPETGVGVTSWQAPRAVKTNLYPVRCKKDNMDTSSLLEYEDIFR